MLHTQRYDFDEIPILSADGQIVAYALFDGYADLRVEIGEGRPYIAGFDGIAVSTWIEDRRTGRAMQGAHKELSKGDPLYRMITTEILRRERAGKIDFPHPDEIAADAAADEAENERSHRLAMVG
ncbi:hypothetical protein ACUSIJ_17835 [Pseudochelatococcus sp. B33]